MNSNLLLFLILIFLIFIFFLPIGWFFLFIVILFLLFFAIPPVTILEEIEPVENTKKLKRKTTNKNVKSPIMLIGL
jgi:energy-coupling factor transporter transmembrane protein EcfT